MTKKKQLGIEAVNTTAGKQFAVVDYSSPVESFSKLLTFREQKEYEATGKLPDGVKKQQSFSVIEQFNTLAEAKKFISKGGRKQKEQFTGIFKSYSQAKLAKRMFS